MAMIDMTFELYEQEQASNLDRQAKSVGSSLGMKVANFWRFSETIFSFTVETELEAYKAAYKYQGPKMQTEVRPAPNVNAWHVTIKKNN